MDILVTFPDGTTEPRAADSACLYSLFDPPSRHPSEERWYLYFPDEARPLSFLARPVATIRDVRGAHDVYVWRLTGEADGALTGEWQAVHVETVDEQIARLTRERDAAVAALRKIASHPARMRWSPEKQASVDADGEPWLHWAEIARIALEGT